MAFNVRGMSGESDGIVVADEPPAMALQDWRAPHPAVRPALADSYLTRTLFGQILGRIERLAWYRTRVGGRHTEAVRR